MEFSRFSFCFLCFILSEIVGLLGWLQSMIELSRTQDEEVGDGTTSVIILGMLFARIFINIIHVSMYVYVCNIYLRTDYHVLYNWAIRKFLLF
jgi:hypothetical protein